MDTGSRFASTGMGAGEGGGVQALHTVSIHRGDIGLRKSTIEVDFIDVSLEFKGFDDVL